jgi:predicted DNA-binding protein YlxM (UPF0122 family)
MISKKTDYIDDLPKDIVDYRVEYLKIEEEKEYFDKVIDKVESIVEDWYWYDKKVFNIHFYEEMSMRKISKETKISLSSIFNTLSNGKKKIKSEAIEEYKRYLDSKN